MQLISKKFKIALLFVVGLCVFTASTKAQTVTIIPTANAGYGHFGYPITIDNILYFKYYNTAGKYQLAKYDGSTLRIITNPSTADAGFVDNLIALGSTLYFRYQNAAGKYQLAEYDGITLKLIPNPSAADLGYLDNPMAIGGTLYFRYQNAAGKYQLAKYDGSNLTLVANMSASDFGYQTSNASTIVFGGNLYFRYINAANKSLLAKYDGNRLTFTANVSTSDLGYIGSPVIIGDTLFVRYFRSTHFQLAKYDGTNLTLINDVGGFGHAGSAIAVGNTLYYKYTGSYDRYYLAKYENGISTIIENPTSRGDVSMDNPIVIGNTLYFSYRNSFGLNYTSNHLAKYDGTNLTMIPNPTTNDTGYYGFPIVLGSSLYFRYYNAYAVDRYKLAKYDGSTITFVPNFQYSNYGYGGDPIVFGSNLYIKSDSYLARYDGSTLTLVASGYSGYPIGIGNTLYFRHYSTSGAYQLAKVTDATLPLNLTAFTANKNNNNTLLTWQTTNEINASHFTIERSMDGTNFQKIGKVEAKGDGGYNYTDDLSSVIPQPISVYYRLQMADKDGSYTYSKVVVVTLNVKSEKLKLFPNPVKDNLFVQVNSIKVQKVTLQITDMQGRVLQQQQVPLQIGNTNTSINTSALTKGSYLLVVKGEVLQQQQFIKE